MKQVATYVAAQLQSDNQPAYRMMCGLIVVVFAIGSLCTSCIAPNTSYVTDIDTEKWQLPATITIPNDDSLSLRDMHLFVRCSDQFEGGAIPLRITLLTPDSMRHSEPFNITLPHRHTASALGREGWVVYRRRVCLGRKGNYQLVICPTTTIKGVEAIGIHLEKSE